MNSLIIKSQLPSKLSDQMAKLRFQCLAVYNKENFPKITKNCH